MLARLPNLLFDEARSLSETYSIKSNENTAPQAERRLNAPTLLSNGLRGAALHDRPSPLLVRSDAHLGPKVHESVHRRECRRDRHGTRWQATQSSGFLGRWTDLAISLCLWHTRRAPLSNPLLGCVE